MAFSVDNAIALPLTAVLLVMLAFFLVVNDPLLFSLLEGNQLLEKYIWIKWLLWVLTKPVVLL